ncbi:IclR family transcriptional regulator domain-containing protein [Ottowia thiooxydans]|uniref:IclR family pca regulon transcriptional regulator n=1 Tax=Ottowia thiooxydans TaxID=219182 RepID=A0ABV2QF02_9BURK
MSKQSDEMESTRSDRVNSLAKGLQVLLAFGRRHTPMTISEVAKEVSLTPASARRMLLTLVDLGYVDQTGKRFSVGPRVLDLGYSYLASKPIWQLTQPVLERFSDAHHVSAAAAVLDGCDALYTIRANSHQPIQVMVSTGTRLPAHITAMGRVLLAALPPQRLDEVISQIKFDSPTERSVANAQELRTILADIRRDGYSIVDEELAFGLRAVAVPLRNRAGEVVASINACGTLRSLEISDLRERVLPALQLAAQEIRMHLAD